MCFFIGEQKKYLEEENKMVLVEDNRSIIIPVRSSDEVVEIFLDELQPDDAPDVIDMLRGELAPLDVWLRFAIEYHKQGYSTIFHEFLQTTLEPGVEQIFNDEASRLSRLKIFNALAGHVAKKFLHVNMW